MIYDFVVIGGGIAGASVAYELSEHAHVILIEAEAQPGYHSSGRSAALFTRNYGTPMVRKINAISEPFLINPPDGFCDRPLLTPRGALAVAGPGDEASLDSVTAASTLANPVEDISVADALAMVPFLRPERTTRAVYEAGVTDIDAALLLQSYVKHFKLRGGTTMMRAPVTALRHEGGLWKVSVPLVDVQGKTIINAAGAWADKIGAMAGARPIGLVAKRRTAIVVDAPEGMNVADLPCVDFAVGDAYIKPEAGKLMASPGDATPDVPQDVQPDEMDIAVLADWISRETLIPVRRIAHSWAGLRSFVADDNPVIGQDPDVESFIWNAGQGGYGIMMAPALANAVAHIGFGQTGHSNLAAELIKFDDISPARESLKQTKF
jgi:D-arginine dehydrogenase